MTTEYWILISLALLGTVAYCFPLLRPKRSTLPILLINKTGKPFPASRDKKNWLSAPKLEKALAGLKKRNYTFVLPQDIAKNQLPQKPVLLVFYGYQNVYDCVYPLLQKYNAKAAVSLAAARIGQYNAWQSPRQGPWQDLLTSAQIAHLGQSGTIEFIASSLDGTDLSEQDDKTACWKLRENKTRLNKLYGLPVLCVHFPFSDPKWAAVWAEARHSFSVIIGNGLGTNSLPLDPKSALRVCPLTNSTNLTRLFWKISCF